MAISINTNIASIRSQRLLGTTQRSLATSFERISSGLRINSARDDAAGLSRAGRLSTQVRGLSVAIKNANDGISFLQTAEGALQEVTTLLQRIQELSVQASNPSNNSGDRALLQGEVAQLNQEITRIAEETEFNGRKVLGGNIINSEFQVGIRAGQTITVSISSTAASNIGNYSTISNNIGDNAIAGASISESSGEAPSNLVQSQILTLRGFNSGVTPPTLTVDNGETAKSIAEKINALEDRSGISATARTSLTLLDIFDPTIDPLTGGAPAQTITFNLYGTNAKSIDSTNQDNAVAISAVITSGTGEGLRPLVEAINAAVATTGVKASFIEEDSTIRLSHDTGANISLEAFRNENSIGSTANTLTVRGIEDSEAVELTEDSDDDSVTVGGIVTLNSPRVFSVTSDADENNSLFASGFNETPQVASFSRLSDLNVSSATGAADAIQIANGALEFINSIRGNLGAVQNRLESTISNLESIRENTQAARGRIEDADFAEETARLTQAQILQQAGTAILAQANTTPSAVLALLRG